jgi:GGDEF domain-containing protein
MRRLGSADRRHMGEFGLDDFLELTAAQAVALTGADAAVIELTEDDVTVVRAVAGTVSPDAAELRVPLLDEGRAVGQLRVYGAESERAGDAYERALRALGHVVGSVVGHPGLAGAASDRASIDRASGLPNRGSWNDQLERALAHAARTNETVSVAVCEVAGGEALVRAVADVWRAYARAADLVARIGRVELALLLPGADELAAGDVLRRLAEAVPVEAAVSFGVAEWDLREDGLRLTARAAARIGSVSTATR